ncbi:MAG: ABC transporter ATP-binding protein [Oscillospiraceae bacterium]
MIEVKNLTKQYGQHTAVSELTFTIEDGRIYGLLGPNGAGKSTTMNILTGCLAATSGEVRVNGYDIFEDAISAKKLIGYLPEQPPLYMDMTPAEYLRFVAKAKGVSKENIEAQLQHVCEVTQIVPVQDRLIRNLSKGYRQRVGIAQALLGDPKVIILDEPTVGLDPKQIIEIRDLIRELGKGHTVILSSHILSEVQAVCDSVMIISHGCLVASDTPENLEKLFAGHSTVELRVRATEQEVQTALLSITDIIETVCQQTAEDGVLDVVVTCKGDADVCEAIFFAFCDLHRPILRMTAARASLEDIFLELTAEQNADPKLVPKTQEKEDSTDEGNL